MLRFMIKLPFRIIAAPVWLVLAAVNIVLVFLVGLSAGFCYLIAGISVVTEVFVYDTLKLPEKSVKNP